MSQPWLPPAGWYPNPEGEGTRYWNGTAWAPTTLPPSSPKAGTGRAGWILVGAAVLLGVAGCITAIVTGGPDGNYSPPSDVSAVDASFLRAVHNHGLTDSQGDHHMITVAHAVCVQLDLGQTAEGLSEHWGLTNDRLSPDSARFYVRTAAAAYCPEHL